MQVGSTPVTIPLPAGGSLPGLLDVRAGATACFVFAHGAGAGMTHGFMAEMSHGLAESGIATLRFQFPYMARGSKRPDSPAVAQAAVRAAAMEAARQLPGLPLFAGGKSYGGRMTSQAQAAEPLPGVKGLVFVGFPLHPAGRPGVDRAEHLAQVAVPMLFLQGTRDELADADLIGQTAAAHADRATLHVVDGADHSFHVLVRSGRNDAQVRVELQATIARWINSLAKAHQTKGPT